MPRVIPCLDVRGGRVVKGVRFQGLRDAGDPATLALAYEEQGGDELVILDVSATAEERGASVETVQRVRRVLGIPLTVGGGVRSIDDARRLLDAGADRVGINTAAVAAPDLIDGIADRFGVQCCVVAIDAARRGESVDRGFEVVTHAGTRRTGIDAAAWAAECARRGAGEILLTSWDRDGTRAGYDLDLLRSVCGATPVPVIASGGADSAGDMRDAFSAGASAVLAASIFHDRLTTVDAVKRALRDMGVAVRTSGCAGDPAAPHTTGEGMP
jgi:imidazoleglycerol phosphate synthase cyclase subunit